MYFVRKKKINIYNTLIRNTFGEQRFAFIGYHLDISMSYRFDIEFLYF